MKIETLLFLDVQTTGMRPPAAHLLELGWSVVHFHEDGQNQEREFQAHLVQLPSELSIPKRVSEITGITVDDCTRDGIPLENLAQKLQGTLDKHQPHACVIHYAQFEKPFLLDLFNRGLGVNALPECMRILCTHRLSKRLFPNLPSQNIRAAAGFFGPAILGPNRVATHVRATVQIWRGLFAELKTRGMSRLSAIETLLQEKPQKKKTGFDYRLDRVKRLNLPESPGVYRMLDKTGQILYVGKATSLHDRVNSYFRGKKGREPRKLEMMAQVWDIQVTPSTSPLEAALLESDEIKRLNPPYNVALKVGERRLIFYQRDFSSCANHQSSIYNKGPYLGHNWIEHLRLLADSLGSAIFKQIFFNPLPPEDLRLGYEIHCREYGLDPLKPYSIRCLLAHGLSLFRKLGPVEPPPTSNEEDGEINTSEEPVEVLPEEIAAKFGRLFRRAGQEYLRTKKLTRLLNSQVILTEGKTIGFRDGQIRRQGEIRVASHRLPWAELGIDTYDRMSIVLSEINKGGARLANSATRASEPTEPS